MKKYEVWVKKMGTSLMKKIAVEAMNRDVAMQKAVNHAKNVLKFKPGTIMIENILDVGV